MRLFHCSLPSLLPVTGRGSLSTSPGLFLVCSLSTTSCCYSLHSQTLLPPSPSGLDPISSMGSLSPSQVRQSLLRCVLCLWCCHEHQGSHLNTICGFQWMKNISLNPFSFCRPPWVIIIVISHTLLALNEPQIQLPRRLPGRDEFRQERIEILKIIPDSYSCRSDERSESDPSNTVWPGRCSQLRLCEELTMFCKWNKVHLTQQACICH